MRNSWRNKKRQKSATRARKAGSGLIRIILSVVSVIVHDICGCSLG